MIMFTQCTDVSVPCRASDHDSPAYISLNEVLPTVATLC